MQKISVALVLATTISISATGCASGSSERPAPSVSASESAAASTAITNIEEARAIVESSFAKLQAAGCVETVTTSTDNFVLYFDPTQSGNQSASINLTDAAKSETLGSTDYFAVGSAKMLIDDPTTEFALIDGGFSLTAPDWLPMNFYAEDGLLVRANGGTDSDFWNAQIEYRTDPAYTEILQQLK